MTKPSAEHVSTAQKMLREYLREGVEVRTVIRDGQIEILPATEKDVPGREIDFVNMKR